MKKSLHVKLFVSFFIVAFIPFYLLLYYTYTQSKEQLSKELIERYQKKLDAIALLMDNDIEELTRELSFLSSLRLMDDIISEDIDKRLVHLIEEKSRVFKLSTNISILDTKGNSIAESLTCKESLGIELKHSIQASFDENLLLGEIRLGIPYSSLSYYFNRDDNAWCLEKSGKSVMNSCEQENAYILSKALHVKDIRIKYLLSKEKLFAPLQALTMQLLRLALFSFAMFIMLFIVMSRLISKPIAQNIALQEQKLHLLEESKHAAETKSRFISQMSHEFRTPLNSIIGFSQFLSQENLVEKEYEKLPLNIEKSGKNLLAMVNQILEFAKSESAHLVVNKEPLHVKKLLQECIAMLEGEASKKSLSIKCECEEIELFSDKQMMESIIINLLANAIKFTQEGEIIISVKVDEAINISIKDSGIGIKASEVSKLFSPFSRLEGSKKIEGSGLGLALCKAYADVLEASLYYVKQDEGSEFVLALKRES